jgi:DNA-binding MarR family transcriptional regulator
VRFSTTEEGRELAQAARALRNAWLDARLNALAPEDRAAIARAAELMIAIADS